MSNIIMYVIKVVSVNLERFEDSEKIFGQIQDHVALLGEF